MKAYSQNKTLLILKVPPNSNFVGQVKTFRSMRDTDLRCLSSACTRSFSAALSIRSKKEAICNSSRGGNKVPTD